MRKKISERLFDKLEGMGLRPAELPKRIRAGYWQRSNGAWRWSCPTIDHLEIGSCDTMSDVLKAKKVSTVCPHFGDIEISVEDV
jgi:hypothetical protein